MAHPIDEESALETQKISRLDLQDTPSTALDTQPIASLASRLQTSALPERELGVLRAFLGLLTKPAGPQGRAAEHPAHCSPSPTAPGTDTRPAVAGARDTSAHSRGLHHARAPAKPGSSRIPASELPRSQAAPSSDLFQRHFSWMMPSAAAERDRVSPPLVR